MDALKLIRLEHKLITEGDFFLIKLTTPKEKSYIAVIDKRYCANETKIAAIKSLTKSVMKNSSVVGGIVIVDSIGSLMNRIQSELIYIRANDAPAVINTALEALNRSKNKLTSVSSLRKSFWYFTTRPEIQELMDYDVAEDKIVSRRKKKYSGKSLGESSDTFQVGDTNSITREQKDFEGHQEWNME